MRNGSEHKASLYQSPNQLCAILKQSLILFHSSFCSFIRDPTGKGAPDTQNVYSDFHRNGWLNQKSELGFIHATILSDDLHPSV
jgi:hypothetical protein